MLNLSCLQVCPPRPATSVHSLGSWLGTTFGTELRPEGATCPLARDHTVRNFASTSPRSHHKMTEYSKPSRDHSERSAPANTPVATSEPFPNPLILKRCQGSSSRAVFAIALTVL